MRRFSGGALCRVVFWVSMFTKVGCVFLYKEIVTCIQVFIYSLELSLLLGVKDP